MFSSPFMIIGYFYFLKIKEIKKNKALVMIIKGPAEMPVRLKPKTPRAQARLPDTSPI